MVKPTGAGYTISLQQKQFIRNGIMRNIRIDGRRKFDTRKIVLHIIDEGSTEVNVGQTKVLCGITSDLVEPREDRPNEGFYRFDVQFTPLAAPSYEGIEEKQEIVRLVERSLKDCKALDSEGLCAVPGLRVWQMTIRMNIIDHCGSLNFACGISAISSLLNAHHPSVSYTNIADPSTISINHNVRVPISIHHLPIPITFALFEQMDQSSIEFIVDPSLEEELSSDGIMVIIVNSQGELCGIDKAGSPALPVSMIMECVKIAAAKAIEVTNTVKKQIKEFHSGARKNTGSNKRKPKSEFIKPASAEEDVSQSVVQEEEENTEDRMVIADEAERDEIFKSTNLFAGEQNWSSGGENENSNDIDETEFKMAIDSDKSKIGASKEQVSEDGEIMQEEPIVSENKTESQENSDASINAVATSGDIKPKKKKKKTKKLRDDDLTQAIKRKSKK